MRKGLVLPVVALFSALANPSFAQNREPDPAPATFGEVNALQERANTVCQSLLEADLVIRDEKGRIIEIRITPLEISEETSRLIKEALLGVATEKPYLGAPIPLPSVSTEDIPHLGECLRVRIEEAIAQLSCLLSQNCLEGDTKIPFARTNTEPFVWEKTVPNLRESVLILLGNILKLREFFDELFPLIDYAIEQGIIVPTVRERDDTDGERTTPDTGRRIHFERREQALV